MSDDLNARAAVFRALSHPARVGLLRLTWHEPLAGDHLARPMTLAPATDSHHLSQFVKVGPTTALPRGHARPHGPDHAALDTSMVGLIRGNTPTPPSADPHRERAQRSFFQGGRLTTSPTQLPKTVGHLSGPGRAPPTWEVNPIPAVVHLDVFTRRRKLAGRGALTHGRGVSWRVTPEGRADGSSPETADTPAAGPLE